LTITDDVGASSSLSTTVKVVKPEEIVKDIKSFATEIDDSAYDRNARQRRNALSDMLEALEKQLTAEEYDEAISKMLSIREKADGSGQDWIIDPDAIKLICYKSDVVIEYLRSLSLSQATPSMYFILSARALIIASFGFGEYCYSLGTKNYVYSLCCLLCDLRLMD